MFKLCLKACDYDQKIKPNKNIKMAPKLRKKKICVLALLVMLDKVENEDTDRRFWVRKIFQERKKYGLYHILTDELRLFDKEWFFRFVRITPQLFEYLL